VETAVAKPTFSMVGTTAPIVIVRLAARARAAPFGT
jgi:hypothetical protein